MVRKRKHIRHVKIHARNRKHNPKRKNYGIHFLKSRKTDAKKTGKHIASPKLGHGKKQKYAKKPLIHHQYVENLKRLLHNLYFTKREEEIIERERENALEIREIGKELKFSEKNMENKLKQIEKETEKIRSLEQSFAIMNAVVEELRKENEALRKDRQFLLDKINDFILEREKRKEEGTLQTIPEETYREEEKSPRMSAYTEQQSRSKINTSLDSLLELIMASGSIKVSDAAKKLRVKDKQIEEWARVLEEHNLIEIHYPTFGKPFLKKKD